MTFVLWLMLAVGSELAFSGLTGRNPADVARSLLQGQKVPDRNSWMPVGTFGKMKEVPQRRGGSGTFGSGKTGDKSIGELASRMVVVEWAKAQLGKTYVFGAAGPNTFDCSGLTMRAYEQVGIYLPHNAAMQQLRGTLTSSPLPGDLVFWGAASGHVAIYLGDGQILHAPQAGDVVKITGTWNEDIISYRSYF